MKIEGQIYYRRAAKAAEMIDLFFFAAETPAKKNAHALRAEAAACKNVFLCDLLALLNIGKSGIMTYSQHSFWSTYVILNKTLYLTG
jgi:hypothetical protein